MWNNLYFADGNATQDCLDAAEAFWNDASDVMVTDCAWAVEDEVVTIDAADGTIVNINAGTGGSGAGNLAQEVLPFATQMLVKWRTASIVDGRRLQGRTFVPALGEGDNDQGVPSSAALTALGTAADNLIADTSTSLVIWGRTGGFSGAVVTAAIGTEFSVLRSRRD